MLIILFLIAAELIFGIDGSFEIGNNFILLAAVIVISGIAHIAILTTAVCSDAKRKKLGARIIWTILTFLFGLPAALFYAMFTFKAGKYEEHKGNRKNLILVIISIILMIAFAAGSKVFVLNRYEYEMTHFPKDMITYKNDDGENVIYDKMGNEYTREEYESFRFYDRDGKVYTPLLDYDVFSNVPEIWGVISAETGEEITEFDGCDFLIDSEGYLIIAPDDEYKYASLGVTYNDERNICYYISDVYWAPDGEMLFYGGEDLSRITYQDIIVQEAQDLITLRDSAITDFFDFFERSDWEYMPYHCTENFWNKYFDENAVLNLESAELINITEQGTADDDEDRYYVVADARCKPSNNSTYYDKIVKYKTLTLKVVFEHDEAYSEWKADEIIILK